MYDSLDRQRCQASLLHRLTRECGETVLSGRKASCPRFALKPGEKIPLFDGEGRERREIFRSTGSRVGKVKEDHAAAALHIILARRSRREKNGLMCKKQSRSAQMRSGDHLDRTIVRLAEKETAQTSNGKRCGEAASKAAKMEPEGDAAHAAAVFRYRAGVSRTSGASVLKELQESGPRPPLRAPVSTFNHRLARIRRAPSEKILSTSANTELADKRPPVIGRKAIHSGRDFLARSHGSANHAGPFRRVETAASS